MMRRTHTGIAVAAIAGMLTAFGWDHAMWQRVEAEQQAASASRIRIEAQPAGATAKAIVPTPALLARGTALLGDKAQRLGTLLPIDAPLPRPDVYLDRLSCIVF